MVLFHLFQHRTCCFEVLLDLIKYDLSLLNCRSLFLEEGLLLVQLWHVLRINSLIVPGCHSRQLLRDLVRELRNSLVHLLLIQFHGTERVDLRAHLVHRSRHVFDCLLILVHLLPLSKLVVSLDNCETVLITIEKLYR